jgi:two-component system, LytTR family, sensor kinase
MKKSVPYLLHALVILLFVLATVSNLRAVSSYYQQPLLNSLLDSMFVNGSILGLIYFSYWLFIPQYLVKKEYIKFILGILIIVFGFSFYLNMADYFLSTVLKIKTHVFDNGWMFGLAARIAFLFGLLGTFLRLFIKLFMDSQDKIELEKQNIKSELSMLKNQLNPHFLFNSLNNIDYLINDNSPNASLALNKLSEIMRYMVYDSEKEFVPLLDEITYIQNYIALQKLRIPNENIITLSINGDPANKQIAPMLFIPFVENIFKHSPLKNKPDNKIEIKFEIQNNELSFYCSNIIADINKDSSSGIGLENVRKRLEMIYKGNYNLTIENQAKCFSVNLDIKL